MRLGHGIGGSSGGAGPSGRARRPGRTVNDIASGQDVGSLWAGAVRTCGDRPFLVWLGADGSAVRLFFLICVIVAGLFGWLTVSRKILFAQALPGAIALAAEIISR